MAKRLSEKITALVLVAFLSLTLPACAKDKFVPYKEAKAALATKPVEMAPEAGSVSPDELKAEQAAGKVIILFDARVKKEYDTEHIAGAKMPRTEEFYKNFALYQDKVIPDSPNAKTALEQGTKNIPRDAAIVTYCHAHCGLSKNLKLDLDRKSTRLNSSH